jgi:histidyl-tRNA synthetase
MDYYNRTVFEWITDKLGSQGTVCGGGRYDPLVEIFGGKPTPAVGFAMGVERLLELMKVAGGDFSRSQCDVYLVHQGDEAQLQSFVIGERLRDAGLDVVLHCAAAGGLGSFKSQMKRADASGAAYAIILGEDEIASGTAIVKHLREADLSNNQQSVSLEALTDHLIDRKLGQFFLASPRFLHLPQRFRQAFGRHSSCGAQGVRNVLPSDLPVMQQVLHGHSMIPARPSVGQEVTNVFVLRM